MYCDDCTGDTLLLLLVSATRTCQDLSLLVILLLLMPSKGIFGAEEFYTYVGTSSVEGGWR